MCNQLPFQAVEIKQDEQNGNYLCKCNNCETVYFDENPQNGANKFTGYWEVMELLNEDNESFWGCPVCKTDGYLCDIFNIEQIERSYQTENNTTS